MPPKPILWLIDTSILVNILNFPDFNQDYEKVIKDFEERIKNGDTFLIPYATFVETGNHLAKLKGNLRFEFAKIFSKLVLSVLAQEAPFRALQFPDAEIIQEWIQDFPDDAAKGISFTDFTIIKEWEMQKDRYPAFSVRIWSLDDHLQGYDSES
ncbi:MAG: hypothetical protein HC913_00710 [Microscillaceae bacterium]|nr:hypothetical protein [Microscillaceae bacterium]